MLKCPKCLGSKLKRDGYTSAGKQVYKCKDCSHRSVKVIGMEQIDWRVDRDTVRSNLRGVNQKKNFVVTSAQNATPVHKTGLNTLKNLCDKNNAQLIVQPYRYRNPNSIFGDKDQDFWVDEVKPYLIDERVNLHDNLVLLGDIKIIPTAINPLRGLQGFTSNESVILGHPKIDMESVATNQGRMAKIMTTTGTITVQNYTDSGAGKKGIHHHSFGAVIVETEGDRFYIRNVQIDNEGCIIDLDTKYYPDGRTEKVSADTVVVPDLHEWWVDKKADNALFGNRGLVHLVRPKYLVYHDLIDTYSVSHHHRFDPFIKYAKHRYGFNNLKKEIEDGVKFVMDKTPEYSEPVIVSSNHDDHVGRYIRECDWRTDPENAEFYLETALHMIRKTKMYEGGTDVPDPFRYWVNKIEPKIKVLKADESFKRFSYELGMHGHLGPNGSRGSPVSLSKIGSKKIVGHWHKAFRKSGLLSVGTLTVTDRDYAKGPSAWSQSAVVLYSNGKASHIHVIDGKYRSRR